MQEAGFQESGLSPKISLNAPSRWSPLRPCFYPGLLAPDQAARTALCDQTRGCAGAAIGELKLEFSDSSKSEKIDAYWRLDGAEFKRAPVVITITGDGFDEGDPIADDLNPRLTGGKNSVDGDRSGTKRD
jgi:hypothetical protein